MWHDLGAFKIKFRLRVLEQQIVVGICVLGGAIDIGKFVTRQAVPALMIKRCRQRKVKILQIENGAPE